MSFMYLFADEIIGFFGKRWSYAIAPLKILCIAMMVHLLVNSFTSLIRGLGKPKLEMKIIMGLTLFVLVPGLYIGISYLGLIGAAVAILINKIALVVTGLYVLNREINVSLKSVFDAVKGALISILLAGFVVFIFKDFIFDNVVFLMALFVAVYGVSVFYFEKHNIKWLISKFK